MGGAFRCVSTILLLLLLLIEDQKGIFLTSVFYPYETNVSISIYTNGVRETLFFPIIPAIFWGQSKQMMNMRTHDTRRKVFAISHGIIDVLTWASRSLLLLRWFLCHCCTEISESALILIFLLWWELQVTFWEVFVIHYLSASCITSSSVLQTFAVPKKKTKQPK